MPTMDYSQYYPFQVRKWLPQTVYPANTIVIAPDASVVKANQDHVSSDLFTTDAAKWTVGGGGGGATPTIDVSNFLTGRFVRSLNGVGGTRAMNPGQRWASPLYVPSAKAIDQLSVNVTTLGAGSLIRLGLYGNSNDSKPGNKIADAAATMDASAIGIKNAAIASGILQPGFYWVVMQAEGAACSITAGSSDYLSERGSTSIQTGAYQYSILNGGGVAGSLPAAWDGNTTDVVVPTVWSRLA